MDINYFGPFNSNVWGTVLEFMTLIVSVIGSILVLASFREQRRINQQQAEINRLSMEKDRREIRPFFKIRKPLYYPIQKKSECQLYLTNAIASTVSFLDKSSDEISINPSVVRKIDWAVDEANKIIVKKNSANAPILIMEIQFHDESGRQYLQLLRLAQEFSISTPMLVPL